MPTDEEVLDTKIWTLAHHLDNRRVTPHIFFMFEGKRLRTQEVVISMGTTPYQVEVRLGSQDTPMAEEPGEGDVRDERRPEQRRAHASSVGPTTSHSGGPEEIGGRSVRDPLDGEGRSAQADSESTARQGSARLMLSEIRDMVSELAHKIDLDKHDTANYDGQELDRIVTAVQGKIENLDDQLITDWYEFRS